MKQSVAALLKVKSIVTFITIGVWAYLAISGAVQADSVQNITLMVIAFYFGTQNERKNLDKLENSGYIENEGGEK